MSDLRLRSQRSEQSGQGDCEVTIAMEMLINRSGKRSMGEILPPQPRDQRRWHSHRLFVIDFIDTIDKDEMILQMLYNTFIL